MTTSSSITPESGQSWMSSAASATDLLPPARIAPDRAPQEAGLPAESTRPASPHPVVLVDPGPTTLVTVWSLRQQAVPIHALSSRWLEPVLWARGVKRHHLPDLATNPLAWSARLLEMVAHLEPRPIAIPCTRRSRDLLRDSRSMLEPHYELAHLEAFALHGYEAEDFRTEQALRRTVLRGEPAFEVQVTIDATGGCTGSSVLAWVAGVPPTVLVSSVDGEDVLERSLQWLQGRNLRGYARLIWAPDRFGRIELQAAGTLPGSGWLLAVDDGVDLPSLWVSSLAGIDVEPQFARRTLSRQFSISKPTDHGEGVPLVPPAIAWSHADPLPSLVRWLAALLRR